MFHQLSQLSKPGYVVRQEITVDKTKIEVDDTNYCVQSAANVRYPECLLSKAFSADQVPMHFYR